MRTSSAGSYRAAIAAASFSGPYDLGRVRFKRQARPAGPRRYALTGVFDLV